MNIKTCYNCKSWKELIPSTRPTIKHGFCSYSLLITPEHNRCVDFAAHGNNEPETYAHWAMHEAVGEWQKKYKEEMLKDLGEMVK